MTTLLFMLLPFVFGTMEDEAGSPAFPSINIGVLETWQVDYASEIQDIGYNWNLNLLVLRSNADGKIYLADPNTCEYVGEIDLPSGAEGFGVGFDSGEYPGRYYINSSISSQIYHSDGSDTWSEIINPAGSDGAGMDFSCMMTDGMLFQASAVSPYQFYCINPGGSYDTFDLPGVNDEISGFMVHEIMTLNEPGALILTTRYGHEFFFYWSQGSEYIQYGQEPCPIPVSESLGLVWNGYGNVYWSYKGLDQEFYISLLEIDVFGGIDDQLTGTDAQNSPLSVISNPSFSSAYIAVNLTAADSATLGIYDLTGRQLEMLHDGQLTSNENIFTFTGPSGLYVAILRTAGIEEKVQFILMR